MQLQVHLHQGLLRVLDVRGGIFCQPFPLAHVGAKDGDPGLRPETVTQQSIRVQLS